MRTQKKCYWNASKIVLLVFNGVAAPADSTDTIETRSDKRTVIHPSYMLKHANDKLVLTAVSRRRLVSPITLANSLVLCFTLC